MNECVSWRGRENTLSKVFGFFVKLCVAILLFLFYLFVLLDGINCHWRMSVCVLSSVLGLSIPLEREMLLCIVVFVFSPSTVFLEWICYGAVVLCSVVCVQKYFFPGMVACWWQKCVRQRFQFLSLLFPCHFFATPLRCRCKLKTNACKDITVGPVA